MAKKNNILNYAGETEAGVKALGGVFKMVDTHGLPLTVIVDFIKDQGFIVAWDEYYESAIKTGWKSNTIEMKMFEAIVDCYGKDYLIKFTEAFKKWKAGRNLYGPL